MCLCAKYAFSEGRWSSCVSPCEMSGALGRELLHLREVSEVLGQDPVQGGVPSGLGLHLCEIFRVLLPSRLELPYALCGCYSDQRWNATAFWIFDVADWYLASAIHSLRLFWPSVPSFLGHLDGAVSWCTTLVDHNHRCREW